eukprot:tig00020510_g9866.t1
MTRIHPGAADDGLEDPATPPAKLRRYEEEARRPGSCSEETRSARAEAWSDEALDPDPDAHAQLTGRPHGPFFGDRPLPESHFGVMVDMLADAKLEEDTAAVLRDVAAAGEPEGARVASPPAPAFVPPAVAGDNLSSSPPIPAPAPAPPLLDPGLSAQPAAAAAAVGPFTRQPAPPPYLFPSGGAAAEVETDLDALASRLEAILPSAPGQQQQQQQPAPTAEQPRTPELASSLAQALSDARLLGTPLFATPGGRLRARRMLASIRFSGYPQLARGVLQALVAALQQSPPDGWTPAAAETAVDHATALLLLGTTEAPRTAHDLFALDWDLCSRLVGRVQLLGGELGAAPGTLRPKALLFCAMAFDRFDKADEAFGMYFEAWAELVKRQLTPGPLEAALIPALADLHFAYLDLSPAMGQHIASKAYALAGSSVAARYSQYLVLHVQVASLRARREIARATALSREALALVEGLGSPYVCARPR